MRIGWWAALLWGALWSCADDHLAGTDGRLVVPAAVDLGNGWADEVLHGAIVVENHGTGWIALDRVESGSDELAATAERDRVAPGGRASIALEWSPSAPSALDTTVRVVTDAGEATVRVTGKARAVPSCDDENPCTDDALDRVQGDCVHTANANPCDDGNACTQGDRCDAGACLGVAITCDDGSLCTTDACDAATGCVFTPRELDCEDGNPCTTDGCAPATGTCTHDVAPDGTSCGPFDCATARVCGGGRCGSIDVSGLTDGLPCDDGDRCSYGDACRAGACEPATRAHGPLAVVRSITTFSGADGAASDGTVFLFADYGRWTAATRNAEGRLVTRGSASYPPFTSGVGLVGPGRFFARYTDGSEFGDALLPIDATDPDHPTIGAPVNLHALGIPRLGRGPEQPAPSGVVFAFDGRAIWWVPLFDGLGRARNLVPAHGDGVSPAAADGSVVAWLEDEVLHWLRLGPGADVQERAAFVLPDRPSKIAVAGNTVAVATSSEIRLYRMAPMPERPHVCDASDTASACSPLDTDACAASTGAGTGPVRRCGLNAPCPAGLRCGTVADDACLPFVCLEPQPSARLVATVHDSPGWIGLVGGALVWQAGLDVHALPLTAPSSAPVTVLSAPGEPSASGGALFHHENHKPIRTWQAPPGDPAAFALVPAIGLGQLTAAVDAGRGRLVLGGPEAAARFDLRTSELEDWTFDPFPQRPRLLLGADRTAPVSPSAPPAGDCASVGIDVLDETLAPVRHAVCGSGLLPAGTSILRFDRTAGQFENWSLARQPTLLARRADRVGNGFLDPDSGRFVLVANAPAQAHVDVFPALDAPTPLRSFDLQTGGLYATAYGAQAAMGDELVLVDPGDYEVDSYLDGTGWILDVSSGRQQPFDAGDSPQGGIVTATYTAGQLVRLDYLGLHEFGAGGASLAGKWTGVAGFDDAIVAFRPDGADIIRPSCP